MNHDVPRFVPLVDGYDRAESHFLHGQDCQALATYRNSLGSWSNVLLPVIADKRRAPRSQAGRPRLCQAR